MRNLIIYLCLFISINSHAQESQFITTNGVKIHYKVYGEGEPVLLLHNFTASHKMWIPWLEDLPKRYKYIIPDLRAHGLSTNPSGIFTHSESAKDMYGLMDALNIQKFRAVGASSGGMTLLHMATMDSTRLESMVTIGATTYFPESCRRIQRTAVYEKIPQDWKSGLAFHHPTGEKQQREVLNLFKNMAYSYDDMNFTPPYLSTIKCPTLIIHGDRDDFFPVNIPTTMYEAIPNAYLWIVPNGGHQPFVNNKDNSIWSAVFIEVLTNFFVGKWE